MVDHEMHHETDFMRALAEVESHPDYRVLRRFKPQTEYNAPRGGMTYRALFLDLETTGLDTATAEVIEFAAARFTFDADGMIYTINDTYEAYEQPTAPIEPTITTVTGITDADVAGCKIDDARVAAMMEGVDLVIAYNADFDRRIAERRFPGVFERVKWACAYRQVQWELYGAVGKKLPHLVTAAGLFYEGHRALVDTLVGVHLLATMRRNVDNPDGGDGWCQVSPMYELLATTKAGAKRVLAHDAAFEWKDRMKARGYQWRGSPPWFIDVESIEAAREEARWLIANAGGKPELRRISARDRYSTREDVHA